MALIKKQYIELLVVLRWRADGLTSARYVHDNAMLSQITCVIREFPEVFYVSTPKHPVFPFALAYCFLLCS